MSDTDTMSDTDISDVRMNVEGERRNLRSKKRDEDSESTGSWKSKPVVSGQKPGLASEKCLPISGSRNKTGVRPGPASSKIGVCMSSRSGSSSSMTSRKEGASGKDEEATKKRRELERECVRLIQKSMTRSQSETILADRPDEEFELDDDDNLRAFEDVQSEVPDDDMIEGSPKRKRKRGRPPTSGEYVQLAAKKKAVLDLRKEEMELEQLKRLKELSSGELYSSMKLDLDTAIEDIKDNPNADIASRARESLDDVLRVCKRSKNLKGDCIRDLKQAAVLASAVVEVLRSRADGGMSRDTALQISSFRKTLEQTRKENKEAQDEIVRLRKELDEIKSSGPRERRRAVIRDSPSPSPDREVAKNAAAKQEGDTRKDTLPEQLPENDDGLVPMEVDAQPEEAESSKPKEKVVLPPRDQWPPVKRPPIKGVVKIIEDRPLEGIKVRVVDQGRKKPDVPPPRSTDGVQAIMAQMMPMMEKWLRSSVEALGLGHAWASTGAADTIQGKTPPSDSHKGKTKKGGKTPAKGKQQPLEGRRETSLPRPGDVAAPPQAEKWRTVVGRRAKKPKSSTSTGGSGPSPSGAPEGGSRTTAGQRGGDRPPVGRQRKAVRRRPPSKAAITLTCPPDGYTEVMRTVTSQINLEDLGIQSLRPKRAATGALVLEVPGPDGAQKASSLKDKLAEVLRDVEGVRVARPIKMADLRVKDIVDSTGPEAIRDAVCLAGGCQPDEVKIGALRRAPNGLCSVWVQCPLVAANKITAQPRLRIGWLSSRVELLPVRQLQCFRCLERGHVQGKCPNDVDRHDVCYRCGQPGHLARGCSSPPRCLVCEAASKPANHRMGGPACKMPSKTRRRVANSELSQTQPRPSDAVHGGSTLTKRSTPVRQEPSKEVVPMEVDPAPLQPSPLPQRPRTGRNGGEGPKPSGNVHPSTSA